MPDLSKTQIDLLRGGAAHRDGVVRPVHNRTNFEQGNSRRAIAGLERLGYIEPNAHGDHYITDAGRAALDEIESTFETADVLTAVTGFVLGDTGIGPAMRVLSYMAGEPIFDFQMPRVGDEARKVLLPRSAALTAIVAEADTGVVNRENWREYRDRWVKLLGPTMRVPKFAKGEHESRNPIDELQEKIGDRPIIIRSE